MRTLRHGLLGLCLLCVGAHGDGTAPYATGHILVRLDETLARARWGGEPTDVQVARFLGLAANTRVQESGFNAWRRARDPVRSRQASRVDPSRYVRVAVPAGDTVEALCARLRKRRGVVHAQPDWLGQGGAWPDDPAFASQWHLSNTYAHAGGLRADIHALEAWGMTTGSPAVVVAVLDTGIAAGLPDFAGRVLPGYNFVTAGTNVTDDHGHGTAVAALLAAAGDNAAGVVGVDWSCRILPVKVLQSNLVGQVSVWIDGIDWAVAQGARVINLSAGTEFLDNLLAEAVLRAYTQGVVIVSIAHNDGANFVRYPARWSEVVAVGASDDRDRRAAFSNYGLQLDLVAPGSNVCSLARDGGTVYLSGTSFAAPLVAGAAALLLARHPGLNPEAVRALLVAGADDAVGGAADPNGFDVYHGWGRLNVHNALLLAETRVLAVGPATGGVHLVWSAPPNAATRRPFAVEYKSAAELFWNRIVPQQNLSFGSNSVGWVDDGSETGATSARRLYRLRVRSFGP